MPDPDPMPDPDYSFCETVTASGATPWHIRPLTAKGRMLSGGADTPSLCGRIVAWDVAVDLTPQRLSRACKRCVDALEAKEPDHARS